MTYKPSSQITWELSPIYNARVYRNPETIAKEEALEDFLFWLKYDSELPTKQAENIEKFLRPLFAEYLNLNTDKAAAGEKELLDLWVKACK